MASTQVTPTRMELRRLKRKLVTAVKGHRLLKDKRDELMRQFLDLVREDMELRKKVEKGIVDANRNFVLAKAGMSEETLRSSLMAPKQEVLLTVDKKNVMSVDIPVFDYQTRTPDENDIYSYGFAFTSSDLDGAVHALQFINKYVGHYGSYFSQNAPSKGTRRNSVRYFSASSHSSRIREHLTRSFRRRMVGPVITICSMQACIDDCIKPP